MSTAAEILTELAGKARRADRHTDRELWEAMRDASLAPELDDYRDARNTGSTVAYLAGRMVTAGAGGLGRTDVAQSLQHIADGALRREGRPFAGISRGVR